jgi:hypothetical protein
MSTKTPLPGLGLLGNQYNVKEYYADSRSVYPLSPIFAFNYSGYDPDNDPSANRTTLYNKDYYFPKGLVVVPVMRSTLTAQNTRSATSFQLQVNLDTQVNGWYEGFSGSMSASFGNNYLNSTSFYSIVQMGMVSAYYLDLPSVDELRDNWLTAQANADINGTLDADSLVRKYGAFFLKSGVFGGSLNYSQSVSRFSVEDQASAAATVSANYLMFIGGSVSASTNIDYVSNNEQSNGVFEAKGGDPATLDQGYETWSSSLTANGEFTLVDFEQPSLQPLSVLATNPSRQQDIDDAIARYLNGTPPNMNTLEVNGSQNHSFYPCGSSSDNIEAQVNTNKNSQVIVGAACKVSNDNVKRVAIKVLDLEDNSTKWITSDGQTYNESDYEVINDIQESTGNRGVAVVGMGFSSNSDDCVGIWLYYQSLNPADDSSSPIYLDHTVQKNFAGKSSYSDATPEANFKPSGGDGKIVTGVGLRVNNDNFKTMKIYQAPLHNVTESATDVVETVGAYM